MTSKRPLQSVSALLLVLVLGACGGNDSNDNQSGNNSGSSAGASDAFFAKVQSVIASSSETTEPVDITSIAVTTPETIEPAAAL